MQKKNFSIKASLHGMNERMQKTMITYLEVTCKGIAQIVEEDQSEIEIIDIDFSFSKPAVEERVALHPRKPILVLSLREVSIDNIIYVKKPLDIPDIKKAIKTAKKNILIGKKKLALLEKLNAYNVSDTIKVTEKSEKTPSPESTELPTSISTPQIKKQPKKKPAPENNTVATKHITVPPAPLASPQKKAAKQLKPKQVPPKLLVDTSKINSLRKELDTGSPQKKPDNTEAASQRLKPTVSIPSPAKPSLSRPDRNNVDKENQRLAIRYGFTPIAAKIKKNSLISLKGGLSVLVLNLSSKGALIELNKSSKLRGKVTLSIKFDSQHFFSIPARIARKQNNTTYGIEFLENQHELSDYLIDSERTLFFI